MSEDKTQVDGELFATEEPEVNPDPVSTTDSGEENKEGLFEEVTEADKNKVKQIQVWQRRYDSGEVDLKDIPKQWVRDAITQPKVDEDAVAHAVAEALAKERSNDRFESLRGDLQKVKLTKLQRAELEVEYDDLKKHLPRDKALEKAMRLAGVDSPAAQRLKEQRMDAILPRSGYNTGPDNPEEDSPMDKPEVDRMKYYEEIRQGANFIPGSV